MAEIIGSKSAQELALNPENVPTNYIHKEGGVGFRDALLPLESIPVVDIANLASQQELHKLHSALSSWGLFQVNFTYIFKHHFLMYFLLITIFIFIFLLHCIAYVFGL
jgi:hypothetical protein